MTLVGLSLALAGLGVLWTGALAMLYLRDPVHGMAVTTHHPEQLPKVMSDRYFAMAFLAFGAVSYRDFAVIAYIFVVFSFLGFADSWIYHRAGKPFALHFAAGVMAMIVAVIALLALNSGVTV